MANIVVDASVLIAVVVNEPEKDALIQLTQKSNLIAPHSIYWEIGNAFSAMLKRDRVSIEDALQAIKSYQKIPIRYVNVELSKALEIANKLDIYAYDAYLIQCAIKYQSPLLTLDRKMAKSAALVNVTAVEV